MNGPSTNINDIVNDNNRLSNEESDMVDSIINDLNSSGSPQTSQEKMPQITDEEREVIMRQKAIQEQERRQYQMQQQQQQIQNQQMKQQEEMINMYSEMNHKKEASLEEKRLKIFFLNQLMFLLSYFYQYCLMFQVFQNF